MTSNARVLGLVPARGGSKGIPGKNIRKIAGKPLIAWTIEAALASDELDAVVVSTDDEAIARVALEYGAQVPFMRPPDIAQDDTPGIEPVLHALGVLPGYDALLLLQPTSPLRSAADIDGCIRAALSMDLVSMVSLCEPSHSPQWMRRMDANGTLVPLLDTPEATRRQDLEPVYAFNGALYYARTAWVIAGRTLVAAETRGYVMPPERSVDIDNLLDWKIAEMLLEEHT